MMHVGHHGPPRLQLPQSYEKSLFVTGGPLLMAGTMPYMVYQQALLAFPLLFVFYPPFLAMGLKLVCSRCAIYHVVMKNESGQAWAPDRPGCTKHPNGSVGRYLPAK
ncbi:hypothetical protein LZ31DRAFT_558284 [Colletotrichum somersetense]|nr:hypothetical protein LZ31DRAFT_558284 [Colletotrichum somersetense]